MKHIKRWALMRNTWQEDIAQHSLQVAMIAHALAVLRNERFGGGANPERAMALAVYHEAPEVITGDMATPIKYFNPGIRSAYKEIEGIAADKLHSMLPDDLRPAYAPLLLDPERDPEWRRVKAADKLSAYIKCIEELNAGNREFSKAADSIRREIDGYDLPEVQAFLAEFLPSFSLTMDELKRNLFLCQIVCSSARLFPRTAENHTDRQLKWGGCYVPKDFTGIALPGSADRHGLCPGGAACRFPFRRGGGHARAFCGNRRRAG